LGLVVPPPLLPPELPQPAASNTRNIPNALPGIKVCHGRLRVEKSMTIEIARAASAPFRRSRWRGRFGADGGTAAVREVVEMTNETVEFGATETAPHAAPVGNPAQVSTYETAPAFVITYVAGEPAGTFCEEGEELNADGFAFDTFRTVLPPRRSAPVSGGPNGATMK
jgi:hypothetical protein